MRSPDAYLVDRILDGVRRKLASDPALLELASTALLSEIRQMGWSKDKWPSKSESFAALSDISRTKGAVSKEDVFFRLNSFFSTESFYRTHVTTGTIVKCRVSGDYLVLASPACDMTKRIPSSSQIWSRSIHPLRSVICLRVESCQKFTKPLNDASAGKFIFIEGPGEKLVFSLLQQDSPSYEIIMLRDAGEVKVEGELRTFSARRLMANKGDENGGGDVFVNNNMRDFTDCEFEVVGQLRTANANRVVQMVTQHLSRIGLDFMSMP